MAFTMRHPDHRYVFLFGSLVLFMIVAPFLKGTIARILTDAFFLWVIISGLVAIQKHRKIAILTMVTGVAAFGLFIWNHFSPLPTSFLVQEVVEVVFLTVLILSILRDVLSTSRVTLDTVYGASCVYLMLGLLWGSIYTILEIVTPGSFSASATWESRGFSELNYFSFVTLTTLGYGDISPVSGPAKVFAMLEAIIGQLFLVILVARLVSLQVSHSQVKD